MAAAAASCVESPQVALVHAQHRREAAAAAEASAARAQKDAAAAEKRHQLQAEAAEREAVRQAAQGNSVRKLSDDQCYRVLDPVLPTLPPLDPADQIKHLRDPGLPDPYLTYQENWCLALGRSHEMPADNIFPGLLPEGTRALSLGNGNWWIIRE